MLFLAVIRWFAGERDAATTWKKTASVYDGIESAELKRLLMKPFPNFDGGDEDEESSWEDLDRRLSKVVGEGTETAD